MPRQMTSHDFNQHIATAKRFVDDGDTVIVTNRGKPRHVLMSYSEYSDLLAPNRTLLDVVMDWPEGIGDIDITFERANLAGRDVLFDVET